MLLDDLLLEVQDLLVDLGEDQALRTQVPMALRALARALPVFGEIVQIATTWWAGTWSDATQTINDITAGLLAGATPYGMGSLAYGDGAVFGCNGLPSSMTFVVSRGQTDGDTSYDYVYWNGSDWKPLVVTQAIDWTQANTQVLRFDIPDDWHKAALTGVTVLDVLGDPLDPTAPLLQRFWMRIQYVGTPFTIQPLFTGFSSFPALYPLSDAVIRLLSTIYYPNELEPVLTEQSLDLWTPGWRALTGTPQYVTQGLTEAHRLQLVPAPTVVGTEGIPLFSGIPAATSGPNNLVLLSLIAPAPDTLPVWAEGLLVLDLVAHEALRETDSQDVPLSQAIQELHTALLGMVREAMQEVGMELESGTSQHIVGAFHG